MQSVYKKKYLHNLTYLKIKNCFKKKWEKFFYLQVTNGIKKKNTKKNSTQNWWKICNKKNVFIENLKSKKKLILKKNYIITS